jgi:hypothetical protein
VANASRGGIARPLASHLNNQVFTLSHTAFFILAVSLVLVCWAIGAYHRLNRLHKALCAEFHPLDAQFTDRHEFIQNWVDEIASDVNVSGHVSQQCENIKAACQQAGAVLDQARRLPGSRIHMTSLGLAEQVLETSLARLLNTPEPSLLESAKVTELTAATATLIFTRQLFNKAVGHYNHACNQIPAHLLGWIWGFKNAAFMPDWTVTQDHAVSRLNAASPP